MHKASTSIKKIHVSRGGGTGEKKHRRRRRIRKKREGGGLEREAGSGRRVQSCSGPGRGQVPLSLLLFLRPVLPSTAQLTCPVLLGEASYLTSLGPSLAFKVELLIPPSQGCCEDNTR